MHEVTTTILPHPISMFIIGALLMGVVILYREYKTLTIRLKEMKSDIEKIMNKIDTHSDSIDEKIQLISKKVDSRVDKAILSIKK